MPHSWKSHVWAQMILVMMILCLFAVPIQGPHGQDLALHPIHHTPVDLEVALHQAQGKIEQQASSLAILRFQTF